MQSIDIKKNLIMDSTAPVGVFDSGVGGLSVLMEIRKQLPEENLIYIADSGYAPYGNRSAVFIENRAKVIVDFLVAANVKAIVVACNTVTVIAINKLRSWCPLPIVAMEPAIKPATRITRSGKIGVLATTQTIASPSVSRLCALYGKDVQVMLQPCPGLVEKVEQMELTSISTRQLLTNYVSPLIDKGVDTIVLGCSHYPFLGKIIQDVAGSDINIIDSAAPVARELSRQLCINQISSSKFDSYGNELFFTSSSVPDAQSIISKLWGKQVEVHDIQLSCCDGAIFF